MKIFRKLYLKILRKFNPIKWSRELGVTVGDNCRLIDVEFSTEPYLIKIGNHVSATKTRFETHDGAVWVLRNERPTLDLIDTIEIGDNVYIGYGTIILPGTRIENNVVIGAGSIVKGLLEANNVYAGVPAKKICTINEYYSKNLNRMNNTKSLTSEEKKKIYGEKFKISS